MLEIIFHIYQECRDIVQDPATTQKKEETTHRVRAGDVRAPANAQCGPSAESRYILTRRGAHYLLWHNKELCKKRCFPLSLSRGAVGQAGQSTESLQASRPVQVRSCCGTIAPGGGMGGESLHSNDELGAS
jgi:hypothetical protein